MLGREEHDLPPSSLLTLRTLSNMAYSFVRFYMLPPLSRSIGLIYGNFFVFFKTQHCCHLQRVHTDFSLLVSLSYAVLPARETRRVGYLLSAVLTMSAH